jgi:hypothetical protein
MKAKEQNIKYCFGLSQERCGTDTFDTIDELLEFAEKCYKDCDGEYWDYDGCTFPDDYKSVIYIGIACEVEPKDFAPSLDDIADQMTDSFYSEHPIDDDQDVQITDRKEAEKAWDEFVTKYFELPCSITATWIGTYDLKKHDWVEKFGKEA